MPDRPAHILEIPDSLGRDVDAYREGRTTHAPPIEAFMSEESLEAVAAATQNAAVHQENMVPITAAEAARRTTFDGEHLPRVPSTRRVIPAPFRRESFNLDRHGRSWQPTRADAVVAGDVVPGVGRIEATEIVTRYETVAGIPDVATGMKVTLVGIAGNRVPFDPGHIVQAFRLAE
jgi:hypothetical protein